MTFVDTNVIIDVLNRDPVWAGWSTARLAEVCSDGTARIGSVVVAELSRGFELIADLRAKLDGLHIVIVPLDEESAFMGGKRFQTFRQAREPGEASRILPDFLIGAHAVTLRAPLLTRDPRLYRRHFPELTLITPETHP